jgi:hypothetical protein
MIQFLFDKLETINGLPVELVLLVYVVLVFDARSHDKLS